MPDLISDRPFIWREQIERHPETGELQRVLAFDGYLHNVGEGSLDLYGNPQIPGDVAQRVFDGEVWEPISTGTAPTVRFETTDGHNHFHLIGISEYALFDETRRFKVNDSSKVGFCLVDTEQVEEVADSFYPIDRYQYCSIDDPESTELRMGITPGWRDTYDANTTLQWVDVSDVQPGKYWIGAFTDPKNEIAESNEDNNGVTYSLNTFAVAGYVATPAPPQAVTAPETVVSLPVHIFGVVGDPRWTITSAPTNGTLDVPIDVALNAGEVRYTPNDGFSGEDSFTWQVRDGNHIFPNEPASQTVRLTVPEPVESAQSPPARTATATEAVLFADFANTPIQGLAHQTVQFEPSRASDGANWFASNLPAGLRIDQATGVISGSPTFEGTYESTILVWDGPETEFQDISWTIDPEGTDPQFRDVNTLQSLVGERINRFVGNQVGGAFETTGLPEGTNVVGNYPWLVGIPTAAGSYEVTVNELADGEVIASTSFIWQVRAAPIPAFPL